MYNDIFISLLKASGKIRKSNEFVDSTPECKSFDSNQGRRYIWRTVGDSKVRSRHASLDGTVRVWGEGLNPGEDYNCRCYPEFVDERLMESGNEEWDSATEIRYQELERRLMTSPYGERTDPVTGKSKSKHSGVDIRSPNGTPIISTRDGRVERQKTEVYKDGTPKGYGNYVRIANNDGTYSEYGHMSEFAKDKSGKDLKNGRKVKKGDVIGYVGSTGKSTGNHLHYTTRDQYNNDYQPPKEDLYYLYEHFDQYN